MDYRLILSIIAILLAAWFAWRYYNLRHEVNEFAHRVRQQDFNTETKELENISSAISSLISTLNLQHGSLESERARLEAAFREGMGKVYEQLKEKAGGDETLLQRLKYEQLNQTERGRDQLYREIARANSAIYEAAQSQPQYAGMGTTLVAVTAENGRVWTNIVTPEVAKVAETLDEFRGRYKYNLLDDNVRRFNAEVPQIWQWDDQQQ